MSKPKLPEHYKKYGVIATKFCSCKTRLFRKACAKCGKKFWTRKIKDKKKCDECITHSNSRVWVVCNNCHRIFETSPTRMQWGRGKFCSVSCRAQMQVQCPGRSSSHKVIFATDDEVTNGFNNGIVVGVGGDKSVTDYKRCKYCNRMLIKAELNGYCDAECRQNYKQRKAEERHEETT